MSWHGTERRHRDDPDRNQLRRRDDLRSVQEELEDVQNELEGLKRLPMALAKLTGLVERIEKQVDRLMDNMLTRFDGLDGKVDKWSSMKTLAGYIAAILVPILVALIGGYFALKAGLRQAK